MKNSKKSKFLHSQEQNIIKDVNTIFENYRFLQKDIENLKSIQSTIQNDYDRIIYEFYQFIFSFKYTKIFLEKKDTIHKHKESISQWFEKLFSGNYDQEYIDYLIHIRESHTKVGLPSHYISTAFSFIRIFLVQILLENQKEYAIPSVEKILDINLDILTLSYQQNNVNEESIEDILLIKNAIKNNTIIPFAQPIISSKKESNNKFEVLMRIPDQDGYITTPIYPLLQTAKRIHLYDDLMRQMLSKTFSIFRDLKYSFSINIGYEDIQNREFNTFLFDLLKDFPNKDRIIFEILENDLITNFDLAIEFIKKLKSLGCKVAIDDFGSGYSSIENLLNLKPDYIKLDSSLIKYLDTSTESYTIVKSIIEMARELRYKTVAEFVHNQEVYSKLKDLNIDYFQGFHTGVPFPCSELAK